MSRYFYGETFIKKKYAFIKKKKYAAIIECYSKKISILLHIIAVSIFETFATKY